MMIRMLEKKTKRVVVPAPQNSRIMSEFNVKRVSALYSDKCCNCLKSGADK